MDKVYEAKLKPVVIPKAAKKQVIYVGNDEQMANAQRSLRLNMEEGERTPLIKYVNGYGTIRSARDPLAGCPRGLL
jgi:hypothetical protein